MDGGLVRPIESAGDEGCTNGLMRKSDSALGPFMSDITVNETEVSQVGLFKAAPPQQQ